MKTETAPEMMRVTCQRCGFETMFPGDNKEAFRDLLQARGWKAVGGQWVCGTCLRPKIRLPRP